MATAGIICEYNPFHRGHALQIRQVRGLLGPETAVICLMSGSFVQRGEPAVYDKYARARSALEAGADLVLELPLTVAVSAAGSFAAGGVDCLRALGTVDFLCFGTETGDRASLTALAAAMGTGEYEDALGEALSSGISYAAARQRALTALGLDAAPLGKPNSALGVDYIRRLLETGSSIRPLALPRDLSLPAASEIRAELLREHAPVHALRYGEGPMLAVLRRLNEADFRDAPFGGEGLWSKVMDACRTRGSYEEILFACKSKRYAMSRLRRMLLCLYLGLSAGDLETPPPYLHALAFGPRGRGLLKTMKETSALPLITGTVPDTPEARGYFEMECRAGDLYRYFQHPDAPRDPMTRGRAAKPVILE